MIADPHPPLSLFRPGTLIAVLIWISSLTGSTAELVETDLGASLFDEANKLYEQTHFDQAIEAYEELLGADPGNATLLFNLGNANYRAGNGGAAIRAYRLAQRIAPRDPSIRFNLNFVREEISGDAVPTRAFWKNAITQLTLNEWTAITVITVWAWFGLLAAREWRPQLRSTLRGYTAGVGIASLVAIICLTSAIQYVRNSNEAVVTAQEAIVRFGPLKEAQVAYQIPDGTEVTVEDRKNVSNTALPETWLQISDSRGRLGWIRESDVVLIQ